MTVLNGWVVVESQNRQLLAGFLTEIEMTNLRWLHVSLQRSDGTEVGTKIISPMDVASITPIPEAEARRYGDLIKPLDVRSLLTRQSRRKR